MRWGVVGKAGIEHVHKEATRLCEHLRGLGEEVHLEQELAEKSGEPERTIAELDDLVDLWLTVGGDGTILMTLQQTDKPVFGVNAGAIGFLAEVEPDQAEAGIEKIMAGDYQVEDRDRLAVWKDEMRLPDATNEATLQTSRIAKLIKFNVFVDGQLAETVRGDGMIVSTATGSTGYAMSVGGPLMHPRVPGLILAPIAPFRLSARPWVVPLESEIRLQVRGRVSAPGVEQARVVVDGQEGYGVADDSVIMIRRSERVARFVRLGPRFYERVRTKLVV